MDPWDVEVGEDVGDVGRKLIDGTGCGRYGGETVAALVI